MRQHPARNPLMLKGGVHTRCKSSVRQTSRQVLLDELDEYLQETQSMAVRKEPPSFCPMDSRYISDDDFSDKYLH